ncbi:hypothetical protein DAT35_45825 [Vitiosangium sp. GDMCC 1.1324]|nr:hypothetical protein DAT35_45825 [Vitiosangium sp. GDMCC 1.1324]
MSFGGAIIDFDFHTVVDELLDEAFRIFITGNETADELRVKRLQEAGAVALQELEVSVNLGDAPLEFGDLLGASFDQYAVGMVGKKTVVIGRFIGLDQDSYTGGFQACSRKHGPVFVFSFDDSSGTYMFSLFRNGERVRFRSRGNGMSDDEGTPLPGEPTKEIHPFDHQMAALEAFVGRSFHDLQEVKMERFDEA